MSPSFEDILNRKASTILSPKAKKRVKHKVHVQAQKYALVPKWRRPRGGKKGQMK